MKKITISVEDKMHKSLAAHAKERSISLESAAVELIAAGFLSLDFKAAEAEMQARFEKKSRELVGDEARRKELFSCAVP